MNQETTPHYTLADLCALTHLAARTVRYYVQTGLVDKPVGETRAARYGAKQLEQLLLIKKWTHEGVSLERIKTLLHETTPPLPAQPRPGNVRVCTHITVAPGVELVLDPTEAGLSPEQIRKLASRIIELYENERG